MYPIQPFVALIVSLVTFLSHTLVSTTSQLLLPPPPGVEAYVQTYVWYPPLPISPLLPASMALPDLVTSLTTSFGEELCGLDAPVPESQPVASTTESVFEPASPTIMYITSSSSIGSLAYVLVELAVLVATACTVLSRVDPLAVDPVFECTAAW